MTSLFRCRCSGSGVDTIRSVFCSPCNPPWVFRGFHKKTRTGRTLVAWPIRVPFAIRTLSNLLRQVFWLSDRLEIAAFPPRWTSKVTGLSPSANLHPRLQRRDRHGISPCSGMPENDRCFVLRALLRQNKGRLSREFSCRGEKRTLFRCGA